MDEVYVVISFNDIDKYLTQEGKDALETVLAAIAKGYEEDGIPMPKYVVSVDEPPKQEN